MRMQWLVHGDSAILGWTFTNLCGIICRKSKRQSRMKCQLGRSIILKMIEPASVMLGIFPSRGGMIMCRVSTQVLMLNATVAAASETEIKSEIATEASTNVHP